jgi:hypothetical protein
MGDWQCTKSDHPLVFAGGVAMRLYASGASAFKMRLISPHLVNLDSGEFRARSTRFDKF